MARLNDDGQWIILMGFLICLILFFLALIINSSILVGQSTAEGVLDFSKSDIQDLKSEAQRIHEVNCTDVSCPGVILKENEVEKLSLIRKNAIVNLTIEPDQMEIHYNNGVNLYNETYIFRPFF